MSGTGAERGQKRAARGERFTAATAAVVRHLPFGLSRVVPPSLLGFAVINGCTFALDLGLLTAFHGGLHWPVPVSITLSYGTATGLSFLLNRTLNFRSHGLVGRQVTIYAGVVVVNYLAWILGVGSGLAALGVEYQAARLIAGVCEGIYMYLAMRLLVFRVGQSPAPPDEPQAPPSGPVTTVMSPGRTPGDHAPGGEAPVPSCARRPPTTESR